MKWQKGTFGDSCTTVDIQLTDRRSEFDHFNWNILQQTRNRSISIAERQKFATIYASNHREAVDHLGNYVANECLSKSELDDLVSDQISRKEYHPWCLLHPGQINLRSELLLHFPYDSFDELLDAIARSAEKLRRVTISVYRLSHNSDVMKLIAYLLEKDVLVQVFMEPNARGNERDNVIIANQLKAMGADVMILSSSKKLHAKFIQLDWRDGKKTSIVMTGNLNETTARGYEDYCLITSNPMICIPMARMIQHLPEGFEKSFPTSENVCFTQLNAVSTLMKYIKQEIEKGEDGYLCIKCNSLTDPMFAGVLEYAATKGVSIDILCRGECTWKPISNNVRIHRFIHQYLEHSRVYVFGRSNPHVYLGSLDLAPHKLYDRFELIVRVLNETHIQEILRTIQNMLGDDTERHYELLSDRNHHWYHMRGDYCART